MTLEGRVLSGNRASRVARKKRRDTTKALERFDIEVSSTAVKASLAQRVLSRVIGVSCLLIVVVIANALLGSNAQHSQTTSVKNSINTGIIGSDNSTSPNSKFDRGTPNATSLIEVEGTVNHGTIGHGNNNIVTQYVMVIDRRQSTGVNNFGLPSDVSDFDIVQIFPAPNHFAINQHGPHNPLSAFYRYDANENEFIDMNPGGPYANKSDRRNYFVRLKPESGLVMWSEVRHTAGKKGWFLCICLSSKWDGGTIGPALVDANRLKFISLKMGALPKHRSADSPKAEFYARLGESYKTEHTNETDGREVSAKMLLDVLHYPSPIVIDIPALLSATPPMIKNKGFDPSRVIQLEIGQDADCGTFDGTFEIHEVTLFYSK